MPKGEPTLEGFERRLRRIFVEKVKRVHVRRSHVQAAGIEWGEGSDTITDLWVDNFQRGLGWGTFHEMVHYVHRHRLAGEGELEEPQVEGLANELWKRIEASKARHAWWRREITARLVWEDD